MGKRFRVERMKGGRILKEFNNIISACQFIRNYGYARVVRNKDNEVMAEKFESGMQHNAKFIKKYDIDN